MHPRLRFWLIVTLGVLVGGVVSFELAQESYAFAALIGVLSAWLLLEWVGGPRPEAWLLALVLAGYLLANRGFAQLLLSPQFPLLPAEAALLAGTAAALLRMAFRQTSVASRDALNLAIFVWMLLGAARLWPDFTNHGVLALRDFAVIYYAFFFFIAQSLARHAASARLLHQATLGAFAALPVIYLVFSQFTDFFLQTIQFRGVPLFYYKDDLVAANLVAGFFLLLTVPSWPWLLRGGLALATYATAFTIQSSRAAIVGLVVTSAWWAVARRWAPWQLQALAAPLAFAALALVATFDQRDFKDSRRYTLYEHGASIVDFTGTGHYASEDRRYVGDNNRFRLAWWRAVAEETRDGGPVFGLGFGADLTSRFLRTYELDLGDDFTTRSPHSIVVTVLGRMGLTGLVAAGWIVAAMTLRTVRIARLVRTNDSALVAFGWWSVSWVMFASACFGVVLEGPMGAILFWTSLGLAHATGADALASAATEKAAEVSAHPIDAALPQSASVAEVTHSA